MAKSYTMPASGIDNTPTVRLPGQYHFMCDAADENPTKKDSGEQIDKLRVDVTVVGGNVPSQMKHKYTFWLRNPNESHKDGGEFCAKIQLRMADAMCLMPKVEPGQELEIDWSKAKGRQFVAFLKIDKGSDGVERLELDGACVYHVDDSEVGHVPKNAQAISLLPAGLRRISTDPANARNQQPANKADAKAANGNGKTAAGAAAATNKPAPVTNPATTGPVGAAAGTVDMNDL